MRVGKLTFAVFDFVMYFTEMIHATTLMVPIPCDARSA